MSSASVVLNLNYSIILQSYVIFVGFIKKSQSYVRFRAIDSSLYGNTFQFGSWILFFDRVEPRAYYNTVSLTNGASRRETAHAYVNKRRAHKPP